MPELPEVETVARGLQKSIAGRRIVSIRLGKTDFIDDPAALEQHLPGRQIEAVERYGKFMLLRLSARTNAVENGDAEAVSLLVHLGMTGQLAPCAAAQPSAKHTHVWLGLDDGRELRYTDPRRFGRMAYLSGAVLAEELTTFGADPLLVSAEEFASRIRSRNAQIKALLRNQSVLRRGTALGQKQANTFRRVLQDVLRKAIVAGGSSISDFLDAEGQPGEYQRHHRAYGREGKRCYRCGAAIRRVIVAGRSSYFCPKCQPAPRLQKRGKGRRRVRNG